MDKPNLFKGCSSTVLINLDKVEYVISNGPVSSEMVTTVHFDSGKDLKLRDGHALLFHTAWEAYCRLDK